MKNDLEIRRLFKLAKIEKTLKDTAIKAGMDVKTARKYLENGRLPSEEKKPHHWRTRKDPFGEIWDECVPFLEINSGVEAKALYEHFLEKYPDKILPNMLRTFQRRVQDWKATEGPLKEVYFDQEHIPGDLCASDFTNLSEIGVTILGKKFDHMLYHFVLTYSNWETGTVCYSESFESVSEGLQSALWELGGVPKRHRTDCLSAAVINLNVKKNKRNDAVLQEKREEFTERYQSLMRHYKLEGQRTNPYSANENGDAEVSHNLFKRALRNKLILRGSKDFNSLDDYKLFLKSLFKELNKKRFDKLAEELKLLQKLPIRRIDSMTETIVRVTKNSVIRLYKNVYSVNSRLIGRKVKIKVYADKLAVWYKQRFIEEIPRLYGKNKHKINYRHIIDSLVRKPGAFRNYKYKTDLFPTIYFRIAYDYLSERRAVRADKEYLMILHLAAMESEEKVDEILRYLIHHEEISFERINDMLYKKEKMTGFAEASVEYPDLNEFDSLLKESEESICR